jgi:L-Ala-D/L-Glu epimerase
MRITSVEVSPLNLELQTALTVAYGSYPVLEYAQLKLHTDDGLLGLGEASPDPEVTGETQAIILQGFDQVKDLLIGQNPFDIVPILSACREIIPDKPAVLAAIDMALYDLMGKALDIPVYQLLGGLARKDIELYPVIPMDAPQVMAAMSKSFTDAGAGILKLKLGSDPQSDLLRMEAIHNAVGSEVTLRLDINQGWRDAETAIAAIRNLRTYNIEYIEQPTAADDLAALAAVTAAVDIPIMADESCHGPADVYQIAEQKAADWINIKLMKCGGINQALKMIAIAEAAGLPCILGSMGESSIGSAAGLHLSLAQLGLKSSELIGPYFINNDPAEGYTIDATIFRASGSEKAGLGVWLK